MVSDFILVFIARRMLVILTAHHALPTIFADVEQVEAGDLIIHGANRPELYRQAGAYIRHVLKVERPSDLPVVPPSKFGLIVNLNPAKAGPFSGTFAAFSDQ